jgi:hypothetical protein
MNRDHYDRKNLTEEDKQEIKNNEIWNAVNHIYEVCKEYQELESIIKILNEDDKRIPDCIIKRKDDIDNIIFNYIKDGV